MIKIFTQRIFIGIFIMFCLQAFGQQTGDYRSKANGNWGDFNTWQIFNGTTWQDAIAGQIPDGTNESDANNVFLEAGFTVVLESNHSCKNLNLNTAMDVVRINTQDNVLNVWGKMRFYEGSAPGSGTPNPVISSGVLGWITTGTNGSIRFRGTVDRVIMVQGEVNANNNNSGWNLDFAFDNGITGELNDRIRAGNIQVTSGILFSNNLSAELRVGTNNGASDLTPNGQFTIKSGAIVKGGSGIFKKSNVAAQNITVESGGVIEISRSSYVLAAATLDLSGTVVLQNAINFPTEAGRTGAVPVNTFNNLTLEGTGAKLLQNSVTVNGKLILAGTSTLSLGSFLLSYGPNGQLEYNGTAQQTTTNAEFPTTNGPVDLIINNSNGVILNASRTINGELSLTNGLFSLGNNNFFLGASSPSVKGNLSESNMVVTNGSGILFKVFDAPGNFIFPVGDNNGTNEFSPAQITIKSAASLNPTNYFGVRVKNAEHPAVAGVAVDDIARYWEVATNMNGFSYNGIFQYLPADVNGNENDLNAYIFSNETAGATGTIINKVNSSQHRIIINNITQVGFVTAANLCAISNNNISTSSATEICSSSTGIEFDGTSAVVASGNPFYQWQQSINGGAWTDILTNGQSEDFTESANLNGGTFSYRRIVSDPATCKAEDVNISNEITITVTDAITGNSIGSNQTIVSGGDADPLVGTVVLSGGNGVFTYQWKSSITQGGPYSNINLANSSSFDVPAGLTETTYFVREVTSGTCTSVSNEITITVSTLSSIKNLMLITSIYPNPISSDKDLVIEMGKVNKNIDFTLFNSAGIVIYKEHFHTQSNLTIDMKPFKKGIYFMKVIVDENEFYMDKIIKE